MIMFAFITSRGCPSRALLDSLCRAFAVVVGTFFISAVEVFLVSFVPGVSVSKEILP